ncbi:MAG TPA: TrkA family potassium uptake protein [Phycisphaerales bacterium]|nr:TrkA family potassium uptake protein [Phycisphaerales bacterium]
MATDLFVVIVGCGRLGSYLANRLSRAGHGVVVIDAEEHAFGNLSPEYSGFRVEGDATELAVLKQAKVNQADLVIATTRADNINLMVAQVAKTEFGVARVLARVFEPRREAVYRCLGVETICPTAVAGEMFLKAVGGEGSA